MFDESKLRAVIQSYKRDFPSRLIELNKWKAVQWFQDHWNIDSEDFEKMFKESTRKSAYLLDSGRSFSRQMIQFFAEKDPSATKEMFQALFDENEDLVRRIDIFTEKAANLLDKYNEKGWRSHYQSTNAISIYLWLRFPEKYYMYKYTEAFEIATELNSDYRPKSDGSAKSVVDCFRLFDEIASFLMHDSEISSVIDNYRTSEMYIDSRKHTLVVDIAFYVSREYSIKNWEPQGYNPGITVQQWVELLEDKTVFNKNSLEIMKRLLDFGGAATCIELAEKYGATKNFYNSGSSSLGKRIHKKTACPIPTEKNANWWPIPYVGKSAPKDRRGSYIWRLRPELLEALEEIDMSNIELYAANKEIDYMGILEYLSANREIPYEDPESVPNTSLREKYTQMRNLGETVVNELDKIAIFCSEYYGLECCAPIRWLDGSGTKTCRYFLVKMKRSEYIDSPISVNIYVEYDREHLSYYRVSLDIENEIANSEQMRQYHTYLDFPIDNSKLCIVSGYSDGVPVRTNLSPQQIQSEIYEGSPSKFQLCSYIYSYMDGKPTDLGPRLFETVELIQSYYDRVMQYGDEVFSQGDQGMKYDKNMILYGPPGTGKTYSTAIYAVAICDGKNMDDLREVDYSKVMNRYEELKQEGRIAFTTFHQSYGYEEFIEGIKPVMKDSFSDSKELAYDIVPGVFKRFCEEAESDLNGIDSIEIPSNAKKRKPYVFIIDEINRGSVSKIFGELITLIEDTKRKGCKEALSAVLPYSGEPFSIPNNVYILGTMNTADRSISLMDTALRRRFRFVENMPDVSILRKMKADIVEDLDVAKMLEVMNERIAFLYDREHTLGHAFFTELKDDPSLERLSSIFEKSIIPLLQEYFYEDYEKIRLVLGDNAKSEKITQFVLKETKEVNAVFKGHADVDIEAKYTINKDAFNNIDSYKGII